jgi:hypothetical protein
VRINRPSEDPHTHDQVLPDLAQNTSDSLASLECSFRTLPIQESATTVRDTFAPGQHTLLLIQSRIFYLGTGDRKFHKWTGDYASDVALSSMA